jgi:TetR/AcrR family transcriptional repressor of lmrAB and yxaGH operons
MPTPPQHREAIVSAAAQLFRRQGYAATGLNEILATSKAPKGSLYHYFPKGKAQIAAEVVRYAGDRVAATLSELIAQQPSVGAAFRRYAELLVGWLEDSDYRDGSPITTALLELAPQQPEVTAAGRDVFNGWSAVLEGGLTTDGVAADTAARLSGLALAVLEGSLVRARVEQDGAAVVSAAALVADLMEAAQPVRSRRAPGRG